VRDKRFVADHRGGLLRKGQHRQLATWACNCSQHVLRLIGLATADRLKSVLKVAEDWVQGKASVGEARSASIEALQVAREAADPITIAVARSVGQAVATAHMADHSLAAAWYALKAVSEAAGDAEKERQWQDLQLSVEIKELVQSAREKKNF